MYIPTPTATNVRGVLGLVRPEGRAGIAEAGTPRLCLRKGDAKQTVTRKSERSDTAIMTSYTDGGKGVKMS